MQEHAFDTVVYRRSKAAFDMVGRALPVHLLATEEKISDGLARRLISYAQQRFYDNGVETFTDTICEIETADCNLPRSERVYTVRFKRKLDGEKYGAEFGIQGIFINRGGWPELDHGAFMDFYG